MTTDLDEYRSVAPKGTVEFLRRLGELVKGRSVTHVSATRYGAGSAEVLRRLVPMAQALGVETRWEVITGVQEFFAVTRRLANALQGQEETPTDEMVQTYLEVTRRNARALALEADLVMVHDHEPAALVEHRAQGKWVWRCHTGIVQPQRRAWSFLRRFLVKYDAAVFSLPQHAQRLPIPQFLVYPAIDPLSDKNRELTRQEVARALEALGIPKDKPILLQVSRYDRFKDPVGVIRAYRLVKKHQDCRLVLAGGGVAHDPEGEAVLAQCQEAAGRDPDVHLLQLPPEADLEINALQRAATIVLQKSIKGGFGLTVAEAMWKGKPVIGETADGLAVQILEDATGYIVHSVEGAAFRIRHLLSNPTVMARMGAAAREHVRRNFLITRQLADYLTLLKLLAT
ncbi:glycosyltransferase [Nitrospira sp. Kam-Ns4a]